MQHAIDISGPFKDRIVDNLEPGEHVVWLGQPLPRYWNRQSLFAFFFGLFWVLLNVLGVLSALGMISMSVSGPSILLIPFLFFGLGLMANPLWMHRKLSRTVYLITDQRVIILDGALFKRNHFIPADVIKDIHRKGKPGEYGEVVIDCGMWMGVGGRRRGDEYAFYDILDHIEVKKKLQALMKQAGEQKLHLPEQVAPQARPEPAE